ncbi:MAG: ATP-binding protein [Coriobacteriales bacterium]|jgi:hypothetical protein|nr:ATP-binding protein [Coriobacteriales bacterium]
MIRGRRGHINLSSSVFRDFIERDLLYVDKSAFIEHVLEENSDVLLITRPRRMGKSLNLNMLRSFMDVKQSSVEEGLFEGLYIEDRPCLGEANSVPVVYLNFKEFSKDAYEEMFFLSICDQAEIYLATEQYSRSLTASLAEGSKLLSNALRFLIESLHATYGTRPFVLIDEYDKLIMDSANTPHFDEVRNFTKAVLSSALKDNPSLGKAVLTGVNRIAQESLFSDLNNLRVLDVFTPSAFDRDFGFTEEEIDELCTPEELASVREWYNGERIGDSLVYFTYSVMSYLSIGKLDNYWGQSGTTEKIHSHLTNDRIDTIVELVNGFGSYEIQKTVKKRLTAQDIEGYSTDASFYSLLVQTGYLTYEPTEELDSYLLRLANRELVSVWRDFILTDLFGLQQRNVQDTLATITDPEYFADAFTDLISNRLSYFDFNKRKPEKTYHAFISGILAGAAIPFASNRESGFGRYDVMALLPDKTIIFEFKTATSAEGMHEAAEEALTQITERNYAADAPPGKPVYDVGIGFYGKEARVAAQEPSTSK